MKPLGVSGLRPSARTYLKEGLVPHSSGQWDERQIPITATRNNTNNTRISRTTITGKIGIKTTVWILQATNNRNFTQEDLDMTMKGKLLERNSSSSNSIQNAIRTNYVKAKIDKMQQNSKCRLYGYRDEAITNILIVLCIIT